MSDGELIRDAATAADIAQARALFEEYAASIGVDLCFQNFSEELATLPGAYARPRGALLLSGDLLRPSGCIGLRPLPDGDPMIGEVKRLYVRPHARGSGLGRALVLRIIADASAIGYRELMLDTLPTMAAARALYASLGFRECAAYYRNPLDGVVYMSLKLTCS
ncbi:MAG TPA: GNAT family N-acetyltransferase [Casimicrobiaceae bacterium]|jgi:ribosomal protein S18 acetylase RimI-like enzyme